MSDTAFHVSLATTYAALACEAWRLHHYRMAFLYGIAAGVSFSFAVALPAWPFSPPAAVWV